MKRVIEKAKILIEALPYIKKFSGMIIVIKYGGSALINEEIKNTVMQDIALMKLVGFKPILVHGGGPDINDMLSRLDIESRFLDGMRITDGQTMEIAEMVLTGKLNKAITGELSLQGIQAVGISGKDGAMLQAKKITPNGNDIGLVGEVKHVNTTLIDTLLENDFVPVISPVAADEKGNTYNINADYAAVAIASAIKAKKLVFLTNTEGIMRDISDSKSAYPRLKVAKVKKMIDDGIVSGGMIPKVACCIDAVEKGVEHVHILDGRLEHCLLLEIFTDEGIGTLIEA